MTNRNKIQKFCKENNIQIKSLEFMRYTEHDKDDSFDNSYWQLELEDNVYCSNDYGSWTVNEGIEEMFKDILEDINNEYS